MNKKDKIIKLSQQQVQPKEIANIVDCSRNYVYSIRSRFWDNSDTVTRKDIKNSKNTADKPTVTEKEQKNELEDKEDKGKSIEKIMWENKDILTALGQNSNDGNNDVM